MHQQNLSPSREVPLKEWPYKRETIVLQYITSYHQAKHTA